jgi:hypothetical protein
MTPPISYQAILTFILSLPMTLSASPVKIMAVGDSLTDNSPGYRGFLYQSLKEEGYDVVFVGPKKGKAPDGGALDHAGHGGFTIGPGPSKADEWTNGKGNVHANIENWLKSEPDIVLLLIGTNEFFNIGKLQPDLNPNVNGPKRLAALVDRIHELKPNVKVLVGSVMPVGWDKNFAEGFNAALPDLLKNKSNIWFVDTSKLSGFTTGDWSSDNLHPSESGYKKLAGVWFEALKAHLTADPALKAAVAEAAARTEAEKAETEKQLRAEATALARRQRGQVIPLWDFTRQKPTYGFVGWQALDQSGTKTPDGWKINASPDGGLGLVLPSPLDLSGATHLVLHLSKDEGGTSDIYLKLICAEGGDRQYSIKSVEVATDPAEIVLPLEKGQGGGNIRVVTQIQIQGNFNKSQKFAYTLRSVEAETINSR